jgi:pyridoxal 5'-phosphate synthase pdxT subunit
MASPNVGVLALQGDFAAHATMLCRAGSMVREVRLPADLDGLDGLVIPGGESTTMTKTMEAVGLARPLCDFAAARKPILGTCAGLIMLDRVHLGLMDILADRNAYGPQAFSFEVDLDVIGYDRPLRAVFIRAPRIVEYGPGVRPVAWVDGIPVAVEEGHMMALAFHPELTGDLRLHERFVAMAATRAALDRQAS